MGYGMHTDFDKACNIAMITDTRIKLQLLNSMGMGKGGLKKAKVIDMLPATTNQKP